MFHPKSVVKVRTLWIDKKSYLIRKMFGSSEFPEFRTETTTTYDPQLNIDIGPDDLKFDPPADAKPREAEPEILPRPRFRIPMENMKIPAEMQVCTANLQKIYAAIKKYKTDKGKLPDWLSDLAPKYLSKEDLLCPTHPDRTKARYSPDPNLPCSYEYEFSPILNAYSEGKLLRERKIEQVDEFGDIVPIVRYLYHGSSTEMALNISVGGQIYWSPWGWEAMFTRSSRSVPEEQPTLTGKTAPSFTLKDLNGKQVSLSDFKGKVVLLDFLATWCGPCRRAIPHLEAFHNKYKDQGLVVIGINHERDHDKVKKFAEENISYIVLLDADREFAEYGIRGIPTAFYIDREGKIRYREIGFGPGREKEVEQKVRELLAIKEDVAAVPKSPIEEVSGTKLLKGTWAWDIDSDSNGPKTSVDIWWEHVNQQERYLVPRNGAGLEVVRNGAFDDLNFSDLSKMEFTAGRTSASDAKPEINVGTVLAVRTTDGNLAKLEVTGFDPLESSRHENAKYHMRLRYVLYKVLASGSAPLN